MYWNALSINPPLQPLFPYEAEQSTRFCSDNETKTPLLRKCWPSNAPVAEKLQHEPQWPWSLISVTAPCSLQSTDSGTSTFAGSTKKTGSSTGLLTPLYILNEKKGKLLFPYNQRKAFILISIQKQQKKLTSTMPIDWIHSCVEQTRDATNQRICSIPICMKHVPLQRLDCVVRFYFYFP